MCFAGATRCGVSVARVEVQERAGARVVNCKSREYGGSKEILEFEKPWSG